MTRPSDRALFLASSTGHFLLQVVAFFWMFSLSMGRAESKAPPGLLETMLTATTSVLAFPFTLALYAFGNGPFWGPLAWIPVIGNSALWAGAVVLARRLLASSRPGHVG